MKRHEEAIPTSVFDTETHDKEMQAQYGMPETTYKPAFLYVERGPGQGQLIELKQGAIVVGRASVSDLRLQHPSISRRHAQVKRVGEQFFIKDLGSQNGTFVNKTRIATEVEMKIGDGVTLGNAQLKLRGPMTKADRPSHANTGAPVAQHRARQSTAVVARPGTSTQPPPPTSNRALKVAVFAGAMGFGLAAVLAFVLVKMMMASQPGTDPTEVIARGLVKAEPIVDPAIEREKQIQEALKKRMAERSAKVEKPEAVADAAPADVPTAEVKAPSRAQPAADERKPPAVVVAKGAPSSIGRIAMATSKKAAPKEEEEAEEEAPKGNSAKRQQILASFERGNAEASLEAAKKAGDKELTDKLSRFITSYEAAKDAVVSNNGTVAITQFTKAKELDDALSSGWSKYGAEIRRQLSSIYVLLGMQYASGGNSANAKKSFEAALKYDPGNARAKSQLEALGGGDEEAEAPKKPVKKAPAKSSIDDAFGD